jgi:ion channel-forming bestrophin family protein
MYVKKNFTFKGVMAFSGGHLVWLTIWATLVPVFIEFLHSKEIFAFQVPWLPVSIIGTAVAFYVGFKNNSSYDMGSS